MMNRMLQNHGCRFLAGNLSVALLTAGIPAAILLAITKTMAASWAVLAILAIVHLSLVGLQISRQGTWIPEKWLAAAFVVLPVVDAWQTVRWLMTGFWIEGFLGFNLAALASVFTVMIVRNKWRKWRAPKPVVLPVAHSGDDHHAQHHHADDPTTMVY
jgi:hypothetical protein